MENKDQNGTLLNRVSGDDGITSPSIVKMAHDPPPGSLTGLSLDDPVAVVPLPSQGQHSSQVKLFLRFARRLDVILVALLIIGAAAIFFATTRKSDTKEDLSKINFSKYGTLSLPLDDLVNDRNLTLAGTSNVTINGYMQLNSGLSIAPSVQPTGAKAGQIYYDQGTNQLAYFNGQNFVFLTDGQQGVQSLGGATGQLTIGQGLGLSGQEITNAGVLTVQGQAGNVIFTAGSGIVLNGTTLSNSGVISITAGNPNVSVSNDGNGNVTISMTGAGTGTVTSGTGGTVGTIPLFTASQNIEDSVITQSGLTAMVTGNLSVTSGNLSLSSALTVSNGGTGATSLTGNGILVGNGASPISSVVAGGAGLCLLSTAGAPTWAACPSAGGVTSLNGLTGALNIANASAAGSTITIDDASTVSKGIASFNGTNFSVSGGAVNTIQDINTGATPTFAGVNTNSITPSAALTVGISVQTALLQGSTTTITSNGVGNNIILNSAGTIELQDNTNVTGNVATSGDIAVNGGDITSTGALNITPGGTLTIGATTQTLTLQGGASTSFRATSGANTTIVGFTSPTANTTLNFPALTAGTYTICTSSGNCAGVATTLQSAYDNSTSPEIILDATRGAVTIRDNATPIGANLLEVQSNNGAVTYLAVTSSGVAVTGTATASGNINTSSGVIQTAGTTRIDNSGNLVNIAAVTASGNATFQGGSVTIGTNAQAGNLVLNDGSSNTGTLQVAALGQNTTYIFPDPGAGSATVCLTTGNCAGVGGGITGTGTTNTVPLFTGAQTIGDSIITQSGTTIDIAGTLTLSNALGAAYGGTGLNATPTNGQLLIGNGTGYSLATLTNNGGLTITNGAGSIGLAVNYGSAAGTAVQGSVALTCPSGTGNLTGGGNSITLGAGGACNSLSTVNNPTFATSVTTPLLASSGALNITPGGALTLGATTQTALLQGSTTTITSNGAGNDIVLTSADQIRFTGFNCTAQANGGVLTTDASGNIVCADDDGAGATPSFQSVYNASNPASFVLNNTNGGLIINDNATPITGPLFAVQNNAGSTSFLEVTTAGIDVAGTAVVSGNITTGGDVAVNGGDITSSGALNITPGGALTVGATSQTATLQGSTLTLSSTGVGNDITFTSADQIILNTSGTIELQDNTNVTGTLAVTGAVTGGTYNGQTISATASFTGTLTAAGTINTTTGALQTAGTTRIDNSGNLSNIGTITATGAATIQGGLTLGASGQAGSFLLYDGGAGVAAHTGTLQVIGTLAQNTTYVLPDPGGASATICLSTGNCAGSGGGITGSGTTNRVSKFTSSGTIGDSTITDDGTDVSITGDFTLQGGTLTAGADAQVGTLTLYDGGTGAAAHTTSLVAGSSAANLTFVLPTGAGSADQCLKKGSGNQLVWDDCDGGAGGSSATFQNVYDNSNPASFTLDGTNGGLIINDNATPIGGTLFAVQNNAGSTTYLNVTSSGVSVTGAATVSGNINTSSGVIQTAGTTRIDNSGNLTNIGGLTLSGAISGGTTYSGSGNINTTGGTLQTNSTTRVDNSGNLVNIGNITASGTATLQGGILTLGVSGQAGTLTMYDGGSGGSAHTATLQAISTLGQNTTYTLPDPGGASATICLSTGNCAGTGGGVTTSGGTANRLPVFSAAQVIADSWLLQNGSTLEIDNTRNLALLGGDLTLQGGDVSVTGAISATSDITSNTQLRILESTGATFYGILDVGDLAADQTFTFLQGGTVVTNGNISTYATTGVTAGSGLTGGGTTGVLTVDIGAGNGIQVNANDIAVLYGSSANTAVQGNTQITVTAGTNLTGGGTLTLGAGGSLTVNVASSPTFSGNVIAQGGSLTVGMAAQAGTLTLYDGGSGLSAHTGVLQVISTLGQNTTYTLPDPGGASATICLNTGNCASSGGGVTTSGGTSGRLAVFNGAQTLVDSWLNQNTSTLELDNTRNLSLLGGNLSVTGTGTFSGDVAVNGGDITSTGGLSIQAAGTNTLALDTVGAGTITVGNANAATVTIGRSGSNASLTLQGLTVVRPTSGNDAANALVVQNGAASETLLSADTTARNVSGGNLIKIGNSTGTDGALTILKLDSATADPTSNLSALNGGLFYNSTSHKVSLVENGVVKIICNTTDLGCGTGTVTLQSAYGNGNTITTTDARDIVFNLDDTSTDSNFLVNLVCDTSCSTNGRFAIQDDGTDVFTISPAGGAVNFRNFADSTAAFNIEEDGGGNLFTVDTTNSRIGINLGGSNTPNINNGGLQVGGSIRMSGSSSHTFTTPNSASINADFSIDTQQVVSGSHLITLGLSDTSDDTATGISVFDDRTNGNHWPTISVWSPDESRLLGLTWAGSSTEGRVTTHNATGTTGGIALQSGDTAGSSTSTGAVAVRSGNGVGSNNSTGAITIDSGSPTGSGTAGAISIGTANTGSITLGNATNNSSITLNSGTGTIAIGTGAQARTINMGTGAAVQTISLGGTSANVIAIGNTQTGGSVSIGTAMTTGSVSLGGNLINLGSNNNARTVNLGTGAAQQIVNIGSSSSTSITSMQAGAGGISIGTSGVANTIQIGNTSGAVAQTINIGNNATASSTTTLVLGSTISSSTTTIQAGTGGLSLTSTANIVLGTADNTGTLLVLDTKNNAGDPTGVEGAMYYSANLLSMRCYFDGKWRNCNDPSSLSLGYDIREDFVSAMYVNDIFGDEQYGELGWRVDYGGTSAGLAGAASEASHPGVVQLNSGTTSNSGYSTLYLNSLNQEPVALAGDEEIEMSVYLPTLATANTTDFNLRFGLCDTSDATDCEDGIYFEYNLDTSASWSLVAANANSRTRIQSSTTACGAGGSAVTVAATTWTRLKMVVNSNASKVDYYINGTFVGCINSANIPTATTQPALTIAKDSTSNGTSTSTRVDYFQMRRSLTTPR